MIPSLAAALLALGLAAPADPAVEKAAAEARRCLDATVKGDFETVLDLTHPKLIELGGGREKLLDNIRAGMDEMKQRGIEFLAGEIEAPETAVESGGKLYTVAPSTLVMKAPGAKIKTRSFLVGISSDRGQTWTFIDGNPGAEKLRETFPEIPEALMLPAPRQPEIETDPEGGDPR